MAELTDLEIQVLCNWIQSSNARWRRPCMSLFAQGPKVVQFAEAKARLRPVLRAV